jgi:hypothetical protein
MSSHEETVRKFATTLVRELHKRDIVPAMSQEILPAVMLAVAAMAIRANHGTLVDWSTATKEAWLTASHELQMDSGIETERPISASFEVPRGYLGDESTAMVQHERLCIQCGGPLKESLTTPISTTLTCFKEGCGAKYKDRGAGGVERL